MLSLRLKPVLSLFSYPTLPFEVWKMSISLSGVQTRDIFLVLLGTLLTLIRKNIWTVSNKSSL